MKKLTLLCVSILLATMSLYAGTADKFKDEFVGSTCGWVSANTDPSSQTGKVEVNDDNQLVVSCTSSNWFNANKTYMIDLAEYPEIAIRIVHFPTKGEVIIKLGASEVGEVILDLNAAYVPEIPGADEEYLNSIYVWNIKNLFQDLGLPVSEPVSIRMQMMIVNSEPGEYFAVDWIRSDAADDKIDPADDIRNVQTVGNLKDDMSSADGWSVVDNGVITNENGTVGVQTTNGTWSIISKEYSENLTEYPYLSANVTSFKGDWALKIAGSDGEKVLNAANAYETGTIYTWNIKEITGLEGDQTFTLQIAAQGGTDSYTTVDWIRSLDYTLRENATSQDGTLIDDMNSVDGWTNIDSGEIFGSDGCVGVRNQNGSKKGWYVIRKDYTENWDEYPYLSVTIGEFNEGWEIKAVCPSGEYSLPLELASVSGKEYTWNLQKITKTVGETTVGIQLLALGNSGDTYFTVDKIKTLKYEKTGGTGSVESVEEPAFNVVGQEGQLKITAPASGTVRVYNPLGVVVKTLDIEMGENYVSGLNGGVYIVQLNNESQRVFVK